MGRQLLVVVILPTRTGLMCHDGTIDLWFDNIGRYINKQYRVTTQKTKLADDVTTCAYTPINNERIQKHALLKPKRNVGNLKEVHKKMKDEIKKANESFRI